MTKYFVCYGVDEAHIEQNVETFELYREAKSFYQSLGDSRYWWYCYKAKYNQNGELIGKTIKEYNFNFPLYASPDSHHFLMKRLGFF